VNARHAALVLASLVALSAVPALAKKKDPEEVKAAIRSMAASTLNDLYAAKPGARGVVESAAGHAVFSNFGMKILLAGSGTGKGVAVNRGSGAETFMRMKEVKVGLGMGVKKFRCVFVFETEDALRRFVEQGWEGGGQASAAAAAGEGAGGAHEGAFAMADGIWVYQMTDKGLVLEATLGATKFYKDDALN